MIKSDQSRQAGGLSKEKVKSFFLILRNDQKAWWWCTELMAKAHSLTLDQLGPQLNKYVNGFAFKGKSDEPYENTQVTNPSHQAGYNLTGVDMCLL